MDIEKRITRSVPGARGKANRAPQGHRGKPDTPGHAGASFSAEDLLKKLHRTNPRIGRATVYRSIDKLVRMKVLDRIEFSDGTHSFRLCESDHHHHHLACTRCHRVVELDFCLESDAIAEIGKRESFKIDDHSITLFGLCRECRHRIDARLSRLSLCVFSCRLPLPRRGTWITPEFSLSLEDLGKMTASLPADIADGIQGRPSAFLGLMARVLDQPADFFILVDKQHPLGEEYVPPDLVPLKEYALRTTWPNLMLRKAIMPEVLQMVRAARADGVTVTFSSTYRPYDYEQGLFAREVRMYREGDGGKRVRASGGSRSTSWGPPSTSAPSVTASKRAREGEWVSAHALGVRLHPLLLPGGIRAGHRLPL